MSMPGVVRVCLRDKTRQLSGLARPWRVLALLAALEAEPRSIPDLLVAAQRLFAGHPFTTPRYDGIFGSVRRLGVDARYTERRAAGGVAIFDLEARRVLYQVRGVGWRRAGWLYYHDGEGFTNRKVPFAIPDSWRVEGAPEDTTPQVEWNEGGPEPFAFLFLALAIGILA